MSYIFIIVTAKTCGHCITFKEQHFERLLDKLDSINNLNVLHIDAPTMQINDYFSDQNTMKKYCKYIKGPTVPINMSLKSYIAWFPQFFLFSMDNWLSNDGKLKGMIFNGEINKDGKIVQSETIINRTADAIFNWIKNKIDNFNISDIGTPKNIQDQKSTEYLPGFLAPSKIKFKIQERVTD